MATTVAKRSINIDSEQPATADDLADRLTHWNTKLEALETAKATTAAKRIDLEREYDNLQFLAVVTSDHTTTDELHVAPGDLERVEHDLTQAQREEHFAVIRIAQIGKEIQSLTTEHNAAVERERVAVLRQQLAALSEAGDSIDSTIATTLRPQIAEYLDIAHRLGINIGQRPSDLLAVAIAASLFDVLPRFRDLAPPGARLTVRQNVDYLANRIGK